MCLQNKGGNNIHYVSRQTMFGSLIVLSDAKLVFVWAHKASCVCPYTEDTYKQR
jgi:hypothetical protein